MARRLGQLVSFLRQGELGMRRQRPDAAARRQYQQPADQGSRAEISLGPLRPAAGRSSQPVRSRLVVFLSSDGTARPTAVAVCATSYFPWTMGETIPPQCDQCLKFPDRKHCENIRRRQISAQNAPAAHLKVIALSHATDAESA